MKRTVLLLLVLLAISTSVAQTRWEYAMMGVSGGGELFLVDATRELNSLPEIRRTLGLGDDGDVLEALNALGQEGYELVSVATYPTAGSTSPGSVDITWTLKRLLP